MVWRSSDKQYPLMALGFNHRAEAFYRCDTEHPENKCVMDAKARGLKKVRVLHWDTPEHIALKVVSLLNQFHEGSSENHFDIMQEALKLEAAWKASCCVTKLNSYNPKYQSAYEEFILAKSSSSEYSGHFKAKQPYYNAISLAHSLQVMGIYDKVAMWSNASVDFLDPKYNAHTCISQMHALTVMIMNGQKKFISKDKISAIVFEALKACARGSECHSLSGPLPLPIHFTSLHGTSRI